MSYILHTEVGDLEVTEYEQFGRLAVRRGFPTEIIRRTQEDASQLFIVDHMNSGVILAYTQSFEEAVRVADDVNIYSKADLSARTTKKLREQFGPYVTAWLLERRGQGARALYVPFRQWLQEKSAKTPRWMRRDPSN